MTLDSKVIAGDEILMDRKGIREIGSTNAKQTDGETNQREFHHRSNLRSNITIQNTRIQSISYIEVFRLRMGESGAIKSQKGTT